MTVFNLYIFDKNGNCTYYREWTKTAQGEVPAKNQLKLLHGMLVVLKTFCSKLSPTESDVSRFSYVTNTYRLHFYESPSLLKIVLNTDSTCAPVHEELETIYRIYTEFVSQNPMCSGEETIQSELFIDTLDTYIKSLQIYKK